MAPTNKKKTERNLFTRATMLGAIQKVRAGMSIRGSAKFSGLNHMTVSRYVKKTANLDEISSSVRLTPNYGVNQVFTKEQEDLLAEYILDRSNLGYGLTVLEVKKLAADYARVNHIKQPKGWESSKQAGKDWYRNFMSRHPNLSARKPEQFSVARAMCFNKPNIDRYFEKLRNTMKRHPNFSSGVRVYNLDETSTTTVGNIKRRIVSPKGTKQVHQVKSAERGINVTTCCIIGAAGVVVPPVMIFPRVNFANELLFGAYPGTKGLATKSGWMTAEMFVEVLRHFISCTGSSKENPTLLTMDNCESHLSVDAIQTAKDNGVVLFTLPPHTTHKTQPLDVGIFGPFQTAYNNAYHDWTASHPGTVCSIKNVASLVNIAMCKSFSPANILSAFRATGICPLNSNVFKDSEFLPSKVTEVLNIDNVPEPDNDAPIDAEIVTDMIVEIDENVPEPSAFQDIDESEKDYEVVETQDQEQANLPTNVTQKPSTFITPAMLKGYPKAAAKKNKTTRRKGKCMVATDTAENKIIEERAAEKQRKEQEKEERKKKREEKKKLVRGEKTKKLAKKTKKSNRKLEFSDSSMDESETRTPSPAPKPVINPTHFEPLDRSPAEGEYVLIEVQARRSQLKYFVGKVLKEVDKNQDLEVTYYRLNQKNKETFALPQVPDLKTVSLQQVKMILPSPSVSSGTKG